MLNALRVAVPTLNVEQDPKTTACNYSVMLADIDSSNWQVGTMPVNGFGGDVLSISLPTAFSTSGKKQNSKISKVDKTQ